MPERHGELNRSSKSEEMTRLGTTRAEAQMECTVDRDTDIVFLYKVLNSRQCFRRRVARDRRLRSKLLCQRATKCFLLAQHVDLLQEAITPIPARLQYSNLLSRMSASSSFGK